jgi:hypothetical protein
MEGSPFASSRSRLGSNTLLQELHVLVATHRRATAELIRCLGEVDVRRLHVGRGFPSLFSYCVQALHFSEDEACRRIDGARLARRFPPILPLLESGATSLTVLCLLKPYLTEENHRELLSGIAGFSVRQAREWIAARFPRPDEPSSIRKHPAPRAVVSKPGTGRRSVGGTGAATPPSAEAWVVHSTAAVPAMQAIAQESSGTGVPRACTESVPPDTSPAPTRVTVQVAPAPTAPPWRVHVEPLSQDRFLVKFTASRQTKEKLEVARDLMLHRNPSGELGPVLESALDLLIADLEKKKFGRTDRPRPSHRPASEERVTSAARRETSERDGRRCSFVAQDGRRCGARGLLEFDHVVPKAFGGDSHATNLRLLCRAHNRWAAERIFGDAHVSRAISTSQEVAVRARTQAEDPAALRTNAAAPSAQLAAASAAASSPSYSALRGASTGA